LVKRYNGYLAGYAGLQLPVQAPWARNIYWLYSLAVRPDVLGMTRDQLAARLQERGIETRPVFHPLHDQPAYRTGIAHPCPVTADIAARGLSLPTGNDMTGTDVDRVCDAITSIMRTQQVFRAQSA
jgi:perosamine synthetase